MKKNDFRLIGLILLVAFLLLAYQYTKKNTGSGVVLVTMDGNTFGTYQLSDTQTVDVNGGNTLKIQEGKARVVHADCPDQLCVNQKSISRDGESIICLPNKVVITIEGGKNRELDAVTN